ncbi:hypothetical protein [Bacteroides acidifaciens]|uniref:hypothetical protein n=1 Tax=Bacteroides acidifaciens TaxID=85831 RepID=UPI003F68DBAC
MVPIVTPEREEFAFKNYSWDQRQGSSITNTSTQSRKPFADNHALRINTFRILNMAAFVRMRTPDGFHFVTIA